MSLAAIAEFIQATTGLCTSTLGRHSLSRAVGQRLVQQGVVGPGAMVSDGVYSTYLNQLRQLPAEQAQLIEALVVPETWFFRDRTPFQMLYGQAHRPPLCGHVLRLLSLPCSTGEEAYSLGATLLEAGVPPNRLQVEGIDISLRAITTAQQGCYGPHSFRGGPVSFGMGAPLDVQARYCQRQADGRDQVIERLRDRVSFRQGNLMAPELFTGGAPYDVIFCRNLLIYFQPQGRLRAIDRLLSQLRPQGLLVVGATEALQIQHPNLVPLADGFAFRYEPSQPVAVAVPAPEVAPPAAVPAPGSALGSVEVPAPVPARAAPARSRRSGAVAPAREPSPPPNPPALVQAQALADQGQLAAAVQHCQTYLRQQPDNVAGLLLLGILEEAQGQLDAAAIAFEKVLYLSPQQGEALLHLALLREKQGYQRAASQLRRRLARVQQRGPVDSSEP